jgi:hypothetical protein
MQWPNRIYTWWQRARRLWRAWRNQLRRKRLALTLLVPLSLGLLEPLACIIHCQVWLPIVLQSYLSAQHHHHHHVLSAAPGVSPAGAVVGSLPESSAPAECFVSMKGSPGTPMPEPPSPVHEMSLAITLLFSAVLLITIKLAAPPLGPPRVYAAVPLRPPIPVAG